MLQCRHIVIDVRRIGDFGIGTYIRNLVRALARLDRENRYTLIVRARRNRRSSRRPGLRIFTLRSMAGPDTDAAA